MRVLVIQLETCVKRPAEPSLYRIPAVTGAHSSCCSTGLRLPQEGFPQLCTGILKGLGTSFTRVSLIGRHHKSNVSPVTSYPRSRGLSTSSKCSTGTTVNGLSSKTAGLGFSGRRAGPGCAQQAVRRT